MGNTSYRESTAGNTSSTSLSTPRWLGTVSTSRKCFEICKMGSVGKRWWDDDPGL